MKGEVTILLEAGIHFSNSVHISHYLLPRQVFKLVSWDIHFELVIYSSYPHSTWNSCTI